MLTATRRMLFVAALAGTTAMAGPAQAGGSYAPYFTDGTQAYNSRVIAGAGPNWYATFIRGVRCHYEYRVQYGPAGPERIRIRVCN